MKRMIALFMVTMLFTSMTVSAKESVTTQAVVSNYESSEESESSYDSSSASVAAPAAVTATAGVSVQGAAPGAAVKTDSVRVAIVNADGSVSAVSLTQQIASVKAVVADLVTSQIAAGKNAGAAVSQMMTKPATPMFRATINALGGNVAINDCGTVKTLATAQDAFGNTIASAGTIKGVTAGSLVMLMSVNADGTVEYVEGIVDPVTGQVMGAFKGAPTTISVLVFVPKQ